MSPEREHGIIESIKKPVAAMAVIFAAAGITEAVHPQEAAAVVVSGDKVTVQSGDSEWSVAQAVTGHPDQQIPADIKTLDQSNNLHGVIHPGNHIDVSSLRHHDNKPANKPAHNTEPHEAHVTIDNVHQTYWVLANYVQFGYNQMHPGKTISHEQAVQKIFEANPGQNPNLLKRGDNVTLPYVDEHAPTQSDSIDRVVIHEGETIWDLVKKHDGHVTASRVYEVAQRSGVNPNNYYDGQVLVFENGPVSSAVEHKPAVDHEEAHVTIHDVHQTYWAMSSIVQAAYSFKQPGESISREHALHMIFEANPGQDPRMLMNGDNVNLPGISDEELKDLMNAVVQYVNLQHSVVPGSGSLPTPNVAPAPAPVADTVRDAESKPQDIKQLAHDVITHPNITFENSSGDRVRKSFEELAQTGQTFVGDIGGNKTTVSSRMLQVFLAVADKFPVKIHSLSTGEHAGGSFHYVGEADDFDAGPNTQAAYKLVYDNREKFGVNELIYAYPPAGTTLLKNGQAGTYDSETIDKHKDHIHMSYGSKDPLPPPPAPASAPKNTVAIGDSILVGMANAGLENGIKFVTGGGNVTINADTGRSITHGGQDKHQSGLEAVDVEREKLENADYAIIELGTNPTDNNYEQALADMVNKIKGINPHVEIYVMDIAATRPDDVPAWDARNVAIYTNAGKLGYKVIRQAQEILGQNINPTVLPAGANIPGSPDGVHGDYQPRVKALLEGMVEVKPVPAAKPAPTPPPKPALPSADQIIMDDLVGSGYTPEQAAGPAGNSMGESGGQVERAQGTPNGVSTPYQNLTPAQLKRGYGLFQWDDATKMINAVLAAGKDPNNIWDQLWFLKQQLSPGGSEHEAGDILRGATTPLEAAYKFAKFYERPLASALAKSLPFRQEQARIAYDTWMARHKK